MRVFFTLLGLLLAAAPAWAQLVYPVTMTTQVAPPYSPLLSDYGSPVFNKLSASIRLNDAEEGSYQVFLRLRINGPGLTLRTRTETLLPPILLDFGAPLLLGSNELAAYLDPANLEFLGLDPQAFAQNGGRLPEGFYSFCFQAFSLITGEAVSNEACASFVIFENNPPILTMPGTQVSPLDPQNVLFRWEQMHSGFTAHYELNIYEINETNQNLAPELILQYSPPFAQYGTGAQKTYLYGPAEIPFELGRSYLVTVRAFDPAGFRTFKNNGLSQPHLFTYGSPCPAPQAISTQVLGSDAAQIAWAPPPPDAQGSMSFRVRYREADNPAANWYEDNVLVVPHSIQGLAPGTRYEVEVQGICGGGGSAYVPGGSFRTDALPQQDPDFECNNAPAPLSAPANTAPLIGAKVGDVFKIGSFDMRVNSISPAGNGYTGTGSIQVPYLQQGLIKVTFTNIGVNTDKVVFSGEVKAVSTGLSSIPGMDTTRVQLGTAQLCEDYVASQLDAHGFDPNGLHYVTGTTQDPFGFDVNGVHQQTGTAYDQNGFDWNGLHEATNSPYNPDGCDRDGYTAEGLPCATGSSGPSAPLANDNSSLGTGAFGAAPAASAEGQAFANGLSEADLALQLRGLINTFISENDSGIQTARAAMRPERDTVLAIIERQGFSRFFVVGDNDEYINEGMSRYYDTRQFEPILPANLREPDVVKMEQGIEAVYFLDAQLQDMLAFADTLDRYKGGLGGNHFAQLTNYMRGLIAALPAEKVASFEADPAAFATWLRGMLYYVLFKKIVPDLLPPEDAGIDLGTEFFREAERWGSMVSREAGASPGFLPGRPADLPLPAPPPSLEGYSLPVKMEKSIGGRSYTIALDNMRFTPTGARLDAFMVLPVSEKPGEKLVFRAYGVPFGKGGIQGEGKLELASNVEIGLGPAGLLRLKGTDKKTYVSWDCEGFQSISLDAEVEFCRSHLLPIDANDAVLPDPQRVKGDFEITVQEWGQFAVAINLGRFMVADLDDVIWTPQDIVFDFSDVETPAAVQFPQNYVAASPDINSPQGEAHPLWRGFYIQSLGVKLPKAFKRKSGQALDITVSHLIIDAQGVTVDVLAQNVLTLEEGDLDGWAFSIDSFRIQLLKSQFEEVAFGGELILPLDEEARFGYSGLVSPGSDYAFSVRMRDTIDVDIWKAEAFFHANSGIDLRYHNGAFTAIATLNGKLVLDGAFNDEGDKFRVPDVAFQNLQILNKKPYIRLVNNGYFGLSNAQAEVAGFKMQLDQIALVKGSSDEEIGLQVKGALMLMGDEGGFGAGGGFKVFAKIGDDNGSQSWRYERFQMTDIALNVQMPGVYILGAISFFDQDPQFGTGFRGALQAEFEPGIGVAAVAQFGRMSSQGGYLYWMVDAAAKLPTPIPIVPSLGIYAVGGGASWHMARDEAQQMNIGDLNVDMSKAMTLGASLSGVKYLPSKDIGLNLRLLMGMATAKPEVLNANVTLEVSFTANWGLNYIALDGSAFVLTPPSLSGAPKVEKAAIRAGLSITYNHRDRVLDGTLMAYMNFYGGTIRGGHPENRLGTIQLHMAGLDDWYMWVGTPSDRLKMAVGLPNGPSLTLDAYLDIGTQIPPFPALPDEVKHLGASLPTPPQASASGFVHGAALRLEGLEFNSGPIYGSIKAGLGYDISFSDAYANVQCGNGGEIGINGWYATGQGYVYIEGRAGVNVDIFGVKKKFELAQLGVAAVVQAQLPNPSWFYAKAQIEYNLLDGKITGKHSAEVELGEQCKQIAQADIFANLNLIEEVSPAEAAQEVNVFTTPQVSFNFAMNQAFNLVDEQGNPYQFRPKLDRIELRDASNLPVPAEQQQNAEGTLVAIAPYDILLGQSDYKLYVKASLEEFRNGQWQPVLRNGVPYTEERLVAFRTGDAPSEVPHSNVLYAYPHIGQYNFYENESAALYLVLCKGQPGLFGQNVDASRYRQRARIVDDATGQIVQEFSHAPLYFSSLQIEGAQRPFLALGSLGADLQPQRVYRVEVVNIPTQSPGGAIDRNLTQSSSTSGNAESNTTITRNTLDGSIEDVKENIVYRAHFRTSRYGTLDEKYAAYAWGSTWRLPVVEYNQAAQNWNVVYQGGNVEVLGKNGTNNYELFEAYELLGDARPITPPVPAANAYRGPSISIAAGDNPWITNALEGQVYRPINEGRLPESVLQRDINILGRVPRKAVYLQQMEDGRSLTEAELTNAEAQSGSPAASSGGAAQGLANIQALASSSQYTFVMYEQAGANGGQDYAQMLSAFAAGNLGSSYYTSSSAGFSTNLTSLVYRVPQQAQVDFVKIRNAIISRDHQNGNDALKTRYSSLITAPLPAMPPGNYPSTLRYRPRGINATLASIAVGFVR